MILMDKNIEKDGKNKRKWTRNEKIGIVSIIVVIIIALITFILMILSWQFPKNPPYDNPNTDSIPVIALNEENEVYSTDFEEQSGSSDDTENPSIPEEAELYNMENPSMPIGPRLEPVSDRITVRQGRAHICDTTFLTFSLIFVRSSYKIDANIVEHNGDRHEISMNSGCAFNYLFNGREFRLTLLDVNLSSCVIIINEIINTLDTQPTQEQLPDDESTESPEIQESTSESTSIEPPSSPEPTPTKSPLHEPLAADEHEISINTFISLNPRTDGANRRIVIDTSENIERVTIYIQINGVPFGPFDMIPFNSAFPRLWHINLMLNPGLNQLEIIAYIADEPVTTYTKSTNVD